MFKNSWQPLLEASLKYQSLALRDKRPGIDHEDMEAIIAMSEEEWKVLSDGGDFHAWTLSVNNFRTKTVVKPMDIFTDEFLDAVDKLYVDNLRTVVRVDTEKTDDDAYAQGMEVYIAGVLEAANDLIYIAETDDPEAPKSIVKETLKSKLVFRLTPAGLENFPHPLLTKSFFEDAHLIFKKNVDAIKEVCI
jgi:hypothetical protein